MNVVINGEKTELSPQSTLAGLLENYELPQAFVIELNGEIIAPESYESQSLKEGDTLEIIRFVGGG